MLHSVEGPSRDSAWHISQDIHTRRGEDDIALNEASASTIRDWGTIRGAEQDAKGLAGRV